LFWRQPSATCSSSSKAPSESLRFKLTHARSEEEYDEGESKSKSSSVNLDMKASGLAARRNKFKTWSLGDSDASLSLQPEAVRRAKTSPENGQKPSFFSEMPQR